MNNLSDRDSKGRFVKNHKAIVSRDKETGKFISDGESRYRRSVSEIDYFLDGRRAS